MHIYISYYIYHMYIYILYIYVLFFNTTSKKLSKHPGIFNILVGRRTPGIKLPSWPFRIRAMLNKFARFFWINKCWQSVGVISIPHSGHDIGFLPHVAFPFQDITRFLQTPGCSVSALASFSFCARAGSTQQGVVCSLGTICRWSTREPHEGISSFEMFRAFLCCFLCRTVQAWTSCKVPGIILWIRSNQARSSDILLSLHSGDLNGKPI